jgi:type IV pilus assembly protein PilB
MTRNQKKTGEILIEKGMLTEDQLKIALQQQVKTKEFLGAILVKNDFIKEGQLLAALSEQFGMPVVSLKGRYLDWRFIRNFSASLMLDYRCFPLQKSEWSVTFAITNPLDIWLLKKVEEEAKGLKVKLVLATQEDIEGCINRYRQYMRSIKE